MRALPLILLAMLAVPASAQAQPYDNYPVCLKVYGPATYSECRYTSMTQCNAVASGRAAQCLVNPYFASATLEPREPRRRHHRAY
jgi:hypothetical protein